MRLLRGQGFIWRSKAILKGLTNKSNGKFIFIKERLSKSDKKEQNYANREKPLKTVETIAPSSKRTSAILATEPVISKLEVEMTWIDSPQELCPNSARGLKFSLEAPRDIICLIETWLTENDKN